MSLPQGMNIPRFENRSTIVVMASWPHVVRGSPETRCMGTLCHLVSGTGKGVSWLAVPTCRNLEALHTTQLKM